MTHLCCGHGGKNEAMPATKPGGVLLGKCSTHFESNPPHPVKEYRVIESEDMLNTVSQREQILFLTYRYWVN